MLVLCEDGVFFVFDNSSYYNCELALSTGCELVDAFLFNQEIYLIAKYDIYLLTSDLNKMCQKQTYIDGLPVLQVVDKTKT